MTSKVFFDSTFSSKTMDDVLLDDSELLPAKPPPRWQRAVPVDRQAEVLSYCKIRFLEGAGWRELFEETGLPQLQYTKLYKQWAGEREVLQSEKIASVLEATVGEKTGSIISQVLDLVANGLAEFQNQQEDGSTITLKDLKTLTSLLKDIHTISRLEEGKATDIKAIANTPPERIFEVMSERAERLRSDHPELYEDEEEDNGL